PPPPPDDKEGAPDADTQVETETQESEDLSSAPPHPSDAMVIGATMGVLFHELGHALIGEFGVPSTGPEEDTADEFSALLMSGMTSSDDFPSKPPEEQKFLQDVVSYATLLWYHDAQKMAAAGQRLPWYDEHSASETRFRNTLCIIYG